MFEFQISIQVIENLTFFIDVEYFFYCMECFEFLDCRDGLKRVLTFFISLRN